MRLALYDDDTCIFEHCRYNAKFLETLEPDRGFEKLIKLQEKRKGRIKLSTALKVPNDIV